MIIHSSLKERVVLSIVIVLFVVNNSWAQYSSTSFDKKIALTGKDLLLDDVLAQISRQTHLHFVYSSNMIDLSKKISPSLDHKSLREVITTLSQQFNFEYVLKGDYVILKKRTITTLSANQNSEAKENPTSNVVIQTQNLNAKSGLSYVYSCTIQSIPNSKFNGNALLQPIFQVHDSTFLKSYNPGTGFYKHWKWTTSYVLFANEQSSGVEIHSGVPFIFGVLNSSRQYDGNYRFGYGVGSSLPLSSNFSFQLIYTFSRMKQNNGIINGALLTKSGFSQVCQQQRIKPMVEYKLNDKITLKAGPSFNFQRIFNSQQLLNPIDSKVITSVSPVLFCSFNNSNSSPVNVIHIKSGTIPSQIPFTYLVDAQPTFWVGFELGISCRINFFPRK